MSVIEERIEPFAWVDGLIYTYPHWLLDVIFYIIYNTFDFTGIYVFTVLIAIIIYLLIYYTNIKVSKNHIISAVITIISIYLFQRIYDCKSASYNIYMFNIRNIVYRTIYAKRKEKIYCCTST